MKKLYILISLVQIVILPGCVNDSNELKLLPLEGKIIIGIDEGYDDYGSIAPPSVFINLTTQKIYGCSNYYISAVCSVEENLIEVFINGIAAPEICLTALGPAAARIKTGLKEGNYILRIRAPGFVDEYSVVLNKGFIRVEGDSTGSTSLACRQFNRYPEKSFVYLCGTVIKDSSLCRMFIDTVGSVIELQQFEFPETGVIPYPQSLYGFEYNMPAKYFYYRTEADYDRIKGIMDSFKRSYMQNTGNYICVTNWMNKSFSIP